MELFANLMYNIFNHLQCGRPKNEKILKIHKTLYGSDGDRTRDQIHGYDI